MHALLSVGGRRIQQAISRIASELVAVEQSSLDAGGRLEVRHRLEGRGLEGLAAVGAAGDGARARCRRLALILEPTDGDECPVGRLLDPDLAEVGDVLGAR